MIEDYKSPSSYLIADFSKNELKQLMDGNMVCTLKVQTKMKSISLSTK
jgi:hypothetical protein